MERNNKLLTKELLHRTIISVIGAPLVLYLVLANIYTLYSLVIFLAIILGMEWNQLTSNATNKLLWLIIGLTYLFIPCFSIIFVANLDNGPRLLCNLIIIVWATDIGGYFFGKLIGGPKLAPKISPNKTWAGFFGGIVFALLVKFITAETMTITDIISFSILAQIGDLIESKIKRKFKATNSGNLIPGHGGIIDTVDGLLFVIPIFALLQLI